MNTLACPLLWISLAQVPSPAFVPESSPAPYDDEAPAQPNSLRLSDVTPRLQEEGSRRFPNSATTEQTYPQRQPTDQTRRAVVPAQRVEPIASVQANDSVALANQILKEALQAAETKGTRTSLVSVLSRGDATRQSRPVHAYWQLSVAIAGHTFAKDEARYLKQLGRPQTRAEESMLRVHIAKAAARQSEASLQVLQRQQQLSDLAPSQFDKLPLPADLPFVGVYRTQIDKMFASQPAPRKLQQIDRELPFQLDLISRRAEAIAACENQLADSGDAYVQGAASLAQVLSAMQDLVEERVKFLDTILDYNTNIADYSLSVVRPGVPATTLLATLIRAETASAPDASSGVRTASAEEPVGVRGQGTGPTFRARQAAPSARDNYRADERASSTSPYTFRRRPLRFK